MGRFLLLVVLAAAVGGSVLAVGTRGTLDAAARRSAEGQADVIAREIAAAGQSAAVSAMLDGDGFKDPTRDLGDMQDYQGGRFEIAYTPGATDHEATVTVTGSYGGAIHTIESSYAYNPMDAPGPMWLDVPYATTSSTSGGEIDGGDGNKPVQFDRRKFDELGLDEVMNLSDLNADLRPGIASMEGALAVPSADAWTGQMGLLNHLNVEDAEGLYQKSIRAFDRAAGDVSYAGAQTVTGRLNFTAGDDDGILMFDDDLTITNGGKLSGKGVLIVNGALVVTADNPATRAKETGELDWEGIVLVRTTEQVLPIELMGKVKIKGMVVVNHLAYAPGGHLDVTVYRDATGMTEDHPEGDRSEQVGWSTKYPWHQHTHAFDVTPAAAPRGDRVYFLEAGRASRHEYQVQLKSLLDKIGSERVYLEIAHPENDGFSLVNLHVNGADGTGGPLETTIDRGFGDFAQADSPHRSQAFPATALQAFDIDVQSLRSLRRAFNGPECEDWPSCIGWDWNRKQALALRLRRASDNARLYEATMYWHMREDETEAHEAEEAAWREKIRSGEAFGTQLKFGDDVTMAFDIDPIDALSERLNFDGDSVVLVSSRSIHLTPDETEADGIDPYHGSMKSGATRSGRTGRIEVCLAGEDLQVMAGELDVYLALGAVERRCGSGGGGSGGGGSGGGGSGGGGSGGSGGMVAICHLDAGTGDRTTRYVTVLALPVHLLHGDSQGSCSTR